MPNDQDFNIIHLVLQAALAAMPDSAFLNSLWQQYVERGSLSKKQLEGLYAKASKLKDINPAWLATLNAVIIKKPTRFKSALPASKPFYEKDESTGEKIAAILSKYPQHKRVLFFKAQYENNYPLTPAELTELDKFCKLLLGTR